MDFDLERAAREAVAMYTSRGGKHDSLALFFDEGVWRISLGNGRCPAVSLGEVDGEVMSESSTIRGAFAGLMAALQDWRPS